IQAEDPISDETRIQALAEIRTNFGHFMETASKSKFSKNHMLGRAFGSVIKMIIDDLSGKPDTMLMLMNMNVTGNYLYQHSLNVCIYSTMLGMVSGYGREDL